jgi:hypothetical protein
MEWRSIDLRARDHPFSVIVRNASALRFIWYIMIYVIKNSTLHFYQAIN